MGDSTLVTCLPPDFFQKPEKIGPIAARPILFG
jgi:hypothetical protein